jgi:hypothetical protein
MAETSHESNGGEPRSAAVPPTAAHDGDSFFEQRIAAFCQQLDAREAERRRDHGRATGFTEVFAAERPLASRILTGIAVVGTVVAGGTGIYLALQDEVETASSVAPPKIAQVIVAPATAAPVPPKEEIATAPATALLPASPPPLPAAQPAPLPDPAPPSVEVAEAARDVPLASAMPPVLKDVEARVASIGDPPPERGRLDREEIVELQRRLNDLGFGAGPLDGVVGRLTRSAIRHYQEFAGLAPTGVADADILERLRQEARGIAASR